MSKGMIAIEGAAQLVREEPGPSCGNCQFGRSFREGLATKIGMVECIGVPPTPVCVGMSANGPAMMLTRPRLEAQEPACALWKRASRLVS